MSKLSFLRLILVDGIFGFGSSEEEVVEVLDGTCLNIDEYWLPIPGRARSLPEEDDGANSLSLSNPVLAWTVDDVELVELK